MRRSSWILHPLFNTALQALSQPLAHHSALSIRLQPLVPQPPKQQLDASLVHSLPQLLQRCACAPDLRSWQPGYSEHG